MMLGKENRQQKRKGQSRRRDEMGEWDDGGVVLPKHVPLCQPPTCVRQLKNRHYYQRAMMIAVVIVQPPTIALIDGRCQL